MAASLPWRRDEKPAELSWLASDPGGTGPPDHATSDDPRRYRVGTISTNNAIRALIIDVLPFAVFNPSRRASADLLFGSARAPPEPIELLSGQDCPLISGR